MDINRRNFMKSLGFAGVALTVGKSHGAEKKPEGETEFYGMLYDSTLCMGCQNCEFTCAETHGLEEPEDEPEAGVVRKTNQNRRTVINCYETSQGEAYIKQQCMHCNIPACDTACLTQAMHKTKKAPVIWREDKCMGCRYCMISCPFDSPKFEYGSTNPKIVKCTMCADRLREGKKPACAENCPMGAITFGKRRDLIKEARKRIHDDPEYYHNHIYGEHEAGGTGWLYIAGVPMNELGFDTNIRKKSYPALTKGFIGAIAPVDILLPGALLGIYAATKSPKEEEE
ncbi:MAG: 4Fe-4S dicluster domain-containing protein [Bacteroidales bacterium]|nr:4Fe-4S dicluster domain-containing protein [Bacteroidales bacterium]MCF8337470.1 4Fe-4S dicluster domain-containing protein [Bacteroidales bacterium]